MSESPRGTPEVPVIAVGASAGGLEAFKRFFRAMSPDTGAAFVVLQHLSPEAPSRLVEILDRETAMPVTFAEDRQPLEANHVYVIPPARELITRDGMLETVPPETAQIPPKPIDRLFRALARSHGPQGHAVIFSGTGDDGVLGLKAIKAAGGLVLAQAPADAEHDAMPRNAAAAVPMDRVLAVEDLVTSLEGFLRRGEPPGAPAHETAPPESRDFTAILRLLYENKRVDFHHYKSAMLYRRVHRRMALLDLDSVADYRARLAEDAQELNALYQDLLVSVTDFFRDPKAFSRLREQVLPDILSQHETNEAIRVWVPGCATGEEAYSIAILLLELKAARGHAGPLRVFATDVDEQALAVARAGVYRASITADVSPNRLQSYFQRIDDQYMVSKTLRESVIFARHDVLRDPPYARLDLVSCRNLLIYLAKEAQTEVLRRFHFALRDPGYLFLGNAENIGDQTQLFVPVQRGQNLYQRLQTVASDQAPSSPALTVHYDPQPAPTSPAPPSRYSRQEEAAHYLMLHEYVPASVISNAEGEILFSFGATRAFLDLPTGKSRLNLFEMAPRSIQATLRVALHNARNHDELVDVCTDDHDPATRIRVRPLHAPVALKGLLLITFERAPAHNGTAPTGDEAERTREEQLREELRLTREELDDKIQTLNASNEELKSYNEEVLSMNEELQSTNEELETSREQMQSLNEELAATNQELQYKVDELEQANTDLANLFSATRMPTLILDRELRIQRYTPAARQLVHLRYSDLGRPLKDLNLEFDDPTLFDDLQAVMRDLAEREQEVRAKEATWYLRRVTPYHDADGNIAGAVITLTDIDRLKTAELEAQANKERWRALANAVPAFIAQLGSDGTIEFANAQLRKWLDVSDEELGQLSLDRILEDGASPREHVASAVHHALEGQGSAFETRVRGNDGNVQDLHVALVAASSKNESAPACYAILTDITERKKHETRWQEQTNDLAETHRLVTMNELAATLAHQIRQPLTALRTNAAMLEKRLTDDEDGARLARNISAQVRAADEVIEEMRGFIRERTPKATDINVNTLIERVATLTEGRQRASGVTLEMRLSEALPMVHASFVLLEQALLNLVINAMEAMDESKVRTLTLESLSTGEQKEVEIRVTDTGPGIPSGQLNVLFQPFHTTKEKGMGMGLAVANSIIEEHGGRLTAESVEGAGTTFVIALPAKG